MNYALDTNVIISILHLFQNVCQNFNAAVERGDSIIIPPIVHYEMRRGFLCKSVPKNENAYQIFVKKHHIGKMNANILECGANIYADLWAKRLTIGELDILIAAFCIENDYTLVTDNIKHFEVIGELKTVNWKL